MEGSLNILPLGVRKQIVGWAFSVLQTGLLFDSYMVLCLLAVPLLDTETGRVWPLFHPA